MKSIEDHKFPNVLPNTAKVIYSWGRKLIHNYEHIDYSIHHRSADYWTGEW